MGFTFGKNWEEFIEKNYSEERVELAKDELLKSLKLDSLAGMTFLDIGLGSGIHSLAAYKAGAEKIVSFDNDADCVRLGKKLAEKVGSPDNWTLLEGSILDTEFVASLGKFDIVYSWGVLSFTGDIALSVKNSASAMNADATLFITLYSYYAYLLGSLWRKEKFGGGTTPEEWLKVKERYHRENSLFMKKWLELKYIYSNCLIPPRYSFKSLSDLYKRVLTYKKKRGMAFMTDVKDWLGGWPMAFVKDDEFNEDNYNKLGLELISMKTGEGITDFFYKNKGQDNYLDNIVKDAARFEFAPHLQKYKNNTYSVDLKQYLEGIDFSSPSYDRWSVRLYRDGKELYSFTGGLDGVLSSTIECYNIIDGVLYYTVASNSGLAGEGLYLTYKV